jgi:serine/threonine-protein kinase
MKIRGPLSLNEASTLLDRLAHAIDESHYHGVVHGAVSPDTVLMLVDGGVFLAPPAAVRPTAAYLSPEERRGEDCTSATDVWSLGALLYESLTGMVPLPAARHEYLVCSGVARWGARRLPEHAACAQIVVDRALRRHPEERYVTAQALANALWEILPDPASHTPAPRVPGSSHGHGRVHGHGAHGAAGHGGVGGGHSTTRPGSTPRHRDAPGFPFGNDRPSRRRRRLVSLFNARGSGTHASP